MRRTCLAVLSVSVSVAAVSANLVPVQGPETYKGHFYYMLPASSWSDAEAAAIGLGGHLVTINDAAENQWVLGTFAGNDYALWTGLNDAAQEGTFAWTSGEPFGYGAPVGGVYPQPPWAANEPSAEGPDYDYVNIHKLGHPTGAGMWNDWPNGGIGTVHGVVEVIPEPATMTLGLLAAGSVGWYVRRNKRLRTL